MNILIIGVQQDIEVGNLLILRNVDWRENKCGIDILVYYVNRSNDSVHIQDWILKIEQKVCNKLAKLKMKLKYKLKPILPLYTSEYYEIEGEGT